MIQMKKANKSNLKNLKFYDFEINFFFILFEIYFQI